MHLCINYSISVLNMFCWKYLSSIPKNLKMFSLQHCLTGIQYSVRLFVTSPYLSWSVEKRCQLVVVFKYLYGSVAYQAIYYRVNVSIFFSWYIYQCFYSFFFYQSSYSTYIYQCFMLLKVFACTYVENKNFYRPTRKNSKYVFVNEYLPIIRHI